MKARDLRSSEPVLLFQCAYYIRIYPWLNYSSCTMMWKRIQTVRNVPKFAYVRKISNFDNRNFELGFTATKCNELDTYKISKSESLIYLSYCSTLILYVLSFYTPSPVCGTVDVFSPIIALFFLTNCFFTV